MKSIRSIVIAKCEKLEQQWRNFPQKKQRAFVIYFFSGYLLLTALVILKVWQDSKTEANVKGVATGHIRNPITDHQGK